jgi:hypothetical protein
VEANIPVLLAGEPGFCTDSYKFFIGSAAGNKGVAMLASPVFTGMVTLPGIRVPLGDAAKNLGIGTGALASINAGLTVNDTVIGVGAMPSDQLIGGNVIVGADAAKTGPYILNTVAIGWKALESAVTQDKSVIIGAAAAPYLNGSNNDVIIGTNAFHPVGGSGVVVIGTNAGHEGTTKTSVIFIGYNAGYYESGSNKLMIDVFTRASESDARIKALIYGVFDALTANQRLSINARLLVRECPNYANNTAALAGGLTSGELYTVTGTDPLQVAKVI